MKTELLSRMNEKADGKKDGVYRLDGVPYRVTNRRVSHYVDFTTVYSVHGAFVVERGRFDYESDAVKAMKKCD